MLVAVVEWLLVAVVPMLAVFDCLLRVEVENSFSGVHVRLALGIVAVAKVVLYIGINTFKSQSAIQLKEYLLDFYLQLSQLTMQKSQ